MELKRKKLKYNKQSLIIVNYGLVRDVTSYISTSSGKSMLVKEMNINHLKNAIAKIKRESPNFTKTLNSLSLEYIYRKVHSIQ